MNHESFLQIGTMIFDVDGQVFSKFPKQQVCRIFIISQKKKCKMKLIFCMQVNIKVTFKLISTLCASNVLQGDTIIIDGWA